MSSRRNIKTSVNKNTEISSEAGTSDNRESRPTLARRSKRLLDLSTTSLNSSCSSQSTLSSKSQSSSQQSLGDKRKLSSSLGRPLRQSKRRKHSRFEDNLTKLSKGKQKQGDMESTEAPQEPTSEASPVEAPKETTSTLPKPSSSSKKSKKSSKKSTETASDSKRLNRRQRRESNAQMEAMDLEAAQDSEADVFDDNPFHGLDADDGDDIESEDEEPESAPRPPDSFGLSRNEISSAFAAVAEAAGLSPSQLAVLFNSAGGISLGGMSSSSSGMNNKLKTIVNQLKGDSSDQLMGLQELAEVLVVATEDMFIGSRAAIEDIVKAIVNILQGSGGMDIDIPPELMEELGMVAGGGINPELLMLCYRCLSNLIEALPSSVSLIVHHNGVAVLIKKLMSIEYIDLAEQVLAVLEKISVEYPSSIIRSNGLLAALQYIDFFGIHVQRMAATIAANAARGLSSYSFHLNQPSMSPDRQSQSSDNGQTVRVDQIFSECKQVLPILERLLSYSDQKMVEQAVKCTFRIIDWVCKSQEKLEELLDTTTLVKTIHAAIHPTELTSGIPTSNTLVFTQLVKILTSAAKGSGKIAFQMLKEYHLVDVIKNVLTSGEFARIEAETPLTVSKDLNRDRITAALMNFVVSKPTDLVLEILNLTSEILPNLPKEHHWNVPEYSQTKKPESIKKSQESLANSERLDLLLSDTTILTQFVSDLVPIFIDVYSATVNSGLRRKVLECVTKCIWYFAGGHVDGSLDVTQPEVVHLILFPVLNHGLGKFISELVGQVNLLLPSFNDNTTLDRQGKDALVYFTGGILLTRTLLLSNGPEFYSCLDREGVFNELNKLQDCPSLIKKSEPIIDVEAISDGVGAGDNESPVKSSPSFEALFSDGDTMDAEAVSDRPSDASAQGKKTAETSMSQDLLASSSSKPQASNETASLSSNSAGLSLFASMKTALDRVRHVVSSHTSPMLTALNNVKYAEEDVKEWCRLESIQLVKDALTFKQSSAATAGNVLDTLTRLATLLKSDASVDPQDILQLNILKEIALLIRSGSVSSESRDAVGVTGYELLESQVMQSLIDYLTLPGVSDKSQDSKGKMKRHAVGRYTTSTLQRCRAFLHVFLKGPSPVKGDYYVADAFKVLIQRLEQVLSRIEKFEVISAVAQAQGGLGESYYGGGLAALFAPRDQHSPQVQLGKQMRVKLVPEDPQSVAKPYQNGMYVTVHAIATFKQLEDFLKARVVVKDSESGNTQENTSESPLLPSTLSDTASSPGKGVQEDNVMIGSNETMDKDDDVEMQDTENEEFDSDEDLESDEEEFMDSDEEGLDVSNILLRAEEQQRLRRRSSIGSQSSATSEAARAVAQAEAQSSSADVTDIIPNSQLDKGKEVSDAEKGGPSSKPPMAPSVKSYASVASNSEYQLEFMMGDVPVTRDTTLFAGAYACEQGVQRGGNKAVANIWSQSYTIKYRRTNVPSKETPLQQSSPTKTPRRPHHQRLPYSTEIPTKMDMSLPYHQILILLRILFGLNSRWPELLDEDVNKTALESYDMVMVPNTLFHNNKLTAKLNKQLDEPLIVASRVLPSWCGMIAKEFPFLVPFESRHIYLQSTSFGYSRSLVRWQQQQAPQASSNQRDVPSVGRIPRQKVRLDRKKLVESMVKVMDLYGPTQSLLEVEYFDEVGTGLGPTLEFYAGVCRAYRSKGGIPLANGDKMSLWREDTMVDSEYIVSPLGLFPCPVSKAQVASDAMRKRLQLFKSLGTFVAKAMLDSRILDLPLSPVFFQLCFNEFAELDSWSRRLAQLHAIKLIDPTLHQSLSDLFECVKKRRAILTSGANAQEQHDQVQAIRLKGAKIEDVCLDFTLPGASHIELVPKGSEQSVTLDNLEEYVTLVLDMVVGHGVRRQVEAFRRGFDKVFPMSDLKSFSLNELGMLLGGDQDEDWSFEAIMDAIKADHGYTTESKAVRHMVTMMSQYTPKERQEFLQFITGATRLPLGGFKSLQPPLTIVRKTVDTQTKSADDYLPSVMTCVNYLKVPDYSNLNVMKKRFEFAIKEGQGAFHLS